MTDTNKKRYTFSPFSHFVKNNFTGYTVFFYNCHVINKSHAVVNVRKIPIIEYIFHGFFKLFIGGH